MLTQHEWETVNETIAEIYRQKTSTGLREAFLRRLKALVDFSFSDFSLGTSKEHGVYKLTDPIIFSVYDEYFEDDFIDQYEKKFWSYDYINWLFNSTESLVYCESDLINGSMRMESPFYKQYLMKFNLVHVAGMIICSENRFIGAVTLYNTVEKGDFSPKDLYIMRQLLPHLQMHLSALSDAERKDSAARPSLLRKKYSLTGRECEVARYIYRGLSNKEIAETLSISEDTVKKHVYHIFQKLEITSRMQIIRFINENELQEYFD